MCAVFRNEGPELSSWLITEACKWAWARWPATVLYTYVDAEQVRSSNPGYCFLRAGWTRSAETSKSGRRMLTLTPVAEAA